MIYTTNFWTLTKKIPGRFLIKFNWLIRPGTASTLIPKDGTVHEWITSVDVVIKRSGIFIGITIRLSVSSKRNWFKLL